MWYMKKGENSKSCPKGGGGEGEIRHKKDAMQQMRLVRDEIIKKKAPEKNIQKMDDKESSRATYDHEKQEDLLGLLNRCVFLDQDTIVRETKH